MSALNFLIWYAPSKISSDIREKVIGFEANASKFIERNINNAGGISGKKVSIDYISIPHEAAGHDEAAMQFYLDCLAKKEYQFIHAPGAFAGVSEYKNKYLESICNSQKIIFSDSTIKNIDITEYNIFDIRSDVFKSAHLTFTDNSKNLLSIFNKKRLFHVANFTDSSPTWGQRAELAQQSIHLVNIDKEAHQNPEALKEFLRTSFQDMTDSDLINFGLFPNAFIHDVTKFSQELAPNASIVMTNDASTHLNFSDLEKDIYIKASDNYEPYLSMENIFNHCAKNLDEKLRGQCNRRFQKFEIPLLIKYIADRDELNQSEVTPLINALIRGLNNSESKKDIYVGQSTSFAFEKNQNILLSSALIKYHLPSPDSDPVKTLHPCQYSIVEGKDVFQKIIAFNIDIESIQNISIEEEQFSVKFYLDIMAEHDDPIECIKFNNLSTSGQELNVTHIYSKKRIEKTSARYYISGNFHFSAIPDNYPFDSQYLYLGISSTDFNMRLQQIPKKYIDKEMRLDGWNLIDNKSGLLSSKQWLTLSEDFKRTPLIKETYRLGWVLKRKNSMTLLKIGIPLIFLYLILGYTLYIPAEEAITSIGFLTTAFLSAIALYFSTERPQPLSMTTIDLVFALFYLTSLIPLTGVIMSYFYPVAYDYTIVPFRYIFPILVISILVIVKSRLSMKKYFDFFKY